MKIVVTGSRGFFGRHLMPVLADRYGDENIAGLTRADYNLLDRNEVNRLFSEQKPHVLIHLAAFSGGIGANRQFAADFYYLNTLLTALMFQAAAEYGLEKLVYPMGGCSYPADASSPIGEDQMWNGFPQPESAGYSTAKKMSLVASTAYRLQYGLNSVVLIPGNMYGEYDNFRTDESHVIPAMVRRCYEAARRKDHRIVMWGTGGPVRDFVYAGDVAAAIPFFIDRYGSSEPVNLSSGTATSIRELAEEVCRLVGFDGEIRWDSTKPDGQAVKIFDIRKMTGLGLSCPTPLTEGLKKTIAWFDKNFLDRGDGLRV